jgi:hypothetical protein
LLEPALRDALGEELRPSPLGSWLGAALRASIICLEDVLSGGRADWRRVELADSHSVSERRALLAMADEDPLWGSLRARLLLETPLVRALSRSLRSMEVAYVQATSWGQQDAHWIENFAFYRDILGVRYAPPLSERVDWWADLVRSCLWWRPYRQICLLSDRPAEIHWIDGQRLHNDAGPALRFRDGWCVWALEGVPVDEDVVLRPKNQSLPTIRGERDAEVKRIRIERYGPARYLAEVGALVIDERRNDVESAHETLYLTPDGEQIFICTGPSPAWIRAIQIPHAVRTCEEARYWLV